MICWCARSVFATCDDVLSGLKSPVGLEGYNSYEDEERAADAAEIGDTLMAIRFAIDEHLFVVRGLWWRSVQKMGSDESRHDA